MNDALRFWVSNANTHFYIIGTAAGPHPYPKMVRDFQSVIGEEAKKQILEKENRLPFHAHFTLYCPLLHYGRNLHIFFEKCMINK